MRTGFGTNSVDHCARLCHSSSVVALIDQIGSEAATAAYTQIDMRMWLLWLASIQAEASVAASIFKCAARQQSVKHVVVDPRPEDEFAEHADIVITHRPGTDIALFNAMAYVLITEGLRRAISQNACEAQEDSGAVSSLTRLEAVARGHAACPRT